MFVPVLEVSMTCQTWLINIVYIADILLGFLKVFDQIVVSPPIYQNYILVSEQNTFLIITVVEL